MGSLNSKSCINPRIAELYKEDTVTQIERLIGSLGRRLAKKVSIVLRGECLRINGTDMPSILSCDITYAFSVRDIVNQFCCKAGNGRVVDSISVVANAPKQICVPLCRRRTVKEYLSDVFMLVHGK